MLHARVNPDFRDARPDRGHRSPIARRKPFLDALELVTGFSPCNLRESAEVLERSPDPAQGLVSHRHYISMDIIAARVTWEERVFDEARVGPSEGLSVFPIERSGLERLKAGVEAGARLGFATRRLQFFPDVSRRRLEREERAQQ
jgi:hypothetical protein